MMIEWAGLRLRMCDLNRGIQKLRGFVEPPNPEPSLMVEPFFKGLTSKIGDVSLLWMSKC